MAEASLQGTAYSNHTSSPSSLAMIGWQDLDTDGIIDVLDVPLTLTGSGYYDPETGIYHFSGSSAVQTLENLNPRSSGHDITINTVDLIQYRVDGGEWIDGNTYGVYAASVSQDVAAGGGYHTVEFRTIVAETGLASSVWSDSFGQADDNYEDNDSWDTAYDPGYNWEGVALSSIDGCGTQQDEDWYAVTVNSGYERLTVDLEFAHDMGNIDLDVRALSAPGDVLATSASLTDDEHIDVVLSEGGTYLLRVYGDNVLNTYDLSWDDVMAFSGAVVDDGEEAYSDSGWNTGAYVGAYEDDYQYARPGSGAGWAEWAFEGLPEGSYEVYVTYLARAYRASDAPFEVLDGESSLGTVRVDQLVAPDDAKWGGYGWESLGTYTVGSGTLTVRLTNDADGNVIADAVRVVPAAPQLSVGDVEHLEGNAGTTAFVFSVTAAAASEETMAVQYATADGTAAAGEDYAAAGGQLIFQPGMVQQTFTVYVYGDAAEELDEFFYVQLTNAANAAIAREGGQGLIFDDDAPTDQVVVDDGSLRYEDTGWSTGAYGGGYEDEYRYARAGDGSEWAAWTFEGVPAGDYVVYATWVARAYRASNAPFEMLDGEQSLGAVLVNQLAAPNDVEREGWNWENLGVYSVSSGTLTVRLTNDADGNVIADAVRIEAVPELSIDSVSLDEGNAGAKDFTFAVSLSVASYDTVTVDYATVDGTAAAGDDYASASGLLAFAPGQTEQSVTVQVSGDTTIESDETFYVQLSNPLYANLADAQGVGTILDDDRPATVQAVDDGDAGYSDTGWRYRTNDGYQGDYRYTPAGLGGESADWVFSGLEAGRYEVYATWTTAPQRATDATYKIIDGWTQDGAAPVNQKLAPDDALWDGQWWESLGEYVIDSGSLTVRLTNAANGTVCADAVRIVTGTPVPELTITDVELAEGDDGTTDFVFTVSASMAGSEAFTVDWQTVDGSATAGEDYTAASGTLSFSAGQMTATLTVQVVGDADLESDETFYIDLSNALGALIADAQSVGTILNDDVAPIDMVIDDGMTEEGNSGLSVVFLPVALLSSNQGTVTVDWSTADGTALAGEDYVAASGTLVFAPGESVKAIAVEVYGDMVEEMDEAFYVNLSNPSGANIVDGQAWVAVLNDDLGAPDIALQSVAVDPDPVEPEPSLASPALGYDRWADLAVDWALPWDHLTGGKDAGDSLLAAPLDADALASVPALLHG